jgi:hypothetical protein
MSIELKQLDLFEVSLVDAGDDPLAKVALYKRKDSPKMDEDTKKIETEIENDSMEEDYEDEEDKGKGKTRKSWKTEALAAQEEIETLKAKVAELEADAVEKNKPKEEVVEVEGEMVVKSSIPAPVLKQLEVLKAEKEKSDLEKMANEKLPNFKGTALQRGKLLKAIGGDTELFEILLAADALFAQMFSEVGKTDSENDMKSPTEKLEEMVKATQVEKKTTYEQAYAEVIKTAAGKELLKQSRKK